MLHIDRKQCIARAKLLFGSLSAEVGNDIAEKYSGLGQEESERAKVQELTQFVRAILTEAQLLVFHILHNLVSVDDGLVKNVVSFFVCC